MCEIKNKLLSMYTLYHAVNCLYKKNGCYVIVSASLYLIVLTYICMSDTLFVNI